MKEIQDIVRAFHQAQAKGLRCALATVVWVEGSSYRRPGARMLVCEDGTLTGAISGGCLEGDALRKALLCIEQQRNKCVVYDTTDEDSAVFGVQLGCGGILHLLLEPLAMGKAANHPLALLERLAGQRQPAVLATLFHRGHPIADHPGTCLLCCEGEIVQNTGAAGHLIEPLRAHAQQALRSGRSCFKDFNIDDATITCFMDVIRPPVSLVVAGAGNDAMALVEMAAQLGWQVQVMDGRHTHATVKRFPKAAGVHAVKPGELAPGFRSDPDTAYLLMTHNYPYDLALLRRLMDEEGFYIGLLGPRKKRERMLAQLQGEGRHPAERHLDRIFGPAGLDIGAETPEEIALSILAEIQAALRRRLGTSLKVKEDPVHPRLVLRHG